MYVRALLQPKFLQVSFPGHVTLHHEPHPVKTAKSCAGVPVHSVFPWLVHRECHLLSA